MARKKTPDGQFSIPFGEKEEGKSVPVDKTLVKSDTRQQPVPNPKPAFPEKTDAYKQKPGVDQTYREGVLDELRIKDKDIRPELKSIEESHVAAIAMGSLIDTSQRSFTTLAAIKQAIRCDKGEMLSDTKQYNAIRCLAQLMPRSLRDSPRYQDSYKRNINDIAHFTMPENESFQDNAIISLERPLQKRIERFRVVNDAVGTLVNAVSKEVAFEKCVSVWNKLSDDDKKSFPALADYFKKTERAGALVTLSNQVAVFQTQYGNKNMSLEFLKGSIRAAIADYFSIVPKETDVSGRETKAKLENFQNELALPGAHEIEGVFKPMFVRALYDDGDITLIQQIEKRHAGEFFEALKKDYGNLKTDPDKLALLDSSLQQSLAFNPTLEIVDEHNNSLDIQKPKPAMYALADLIYVARWGQLLESLQPKKLMDKFPPAGDEMLGRA